ncbi:cytochrome b subunit of succinate dehydrogenase, Sdh3p [Coemansia sp. RSA 2703]|nr:cytochrome b subunit of succinate dehydrogenase, Sdh3p [Coemansia sp. RSA 2703]KAJ2379443.1 cytochrome b subunit of succinate dehydrogenase, Sdh3p [Coemansia sp. RSA 2607]
MFSAVSRSGILNATRTPLHRAIAGQSARAFIATPARRTVDEPQSVVAERALKNRPISPHLSIYKPQMTWVLSGLHRNTGVLVAGAAYLYTAAFGLAPMFGLDLSSLAVASTLAAAPTPLLLAVKALVSGSLSFHCVNGVRHLVWDSGKGLNNKGVINSGYVVIGATALLTGYLTFF